MATRIVIPSGAGALTGLRALLTDFANMPSLADSEVA